MPLKNDIYSAVDSILDNQMDINEVNYVPSIDDSDITFGLTGKRLQCVCFYIDMRGSTALLEKHNANVVIKIHKAYFITILKIVKSLGGEVRSFNGDSVLAFFMGTDASSIEAAIKAAMQIKYLLLVEENCLKNKVYSKYQTTIDIGVGLDLGTTAVAKVGISGGNNRDLIWIGSNVNHSVKISDQCKSYNNIGISERLYVNLTNPAKYSDNKDMWQKSSYQYNNQIEPMYITNYHWVVN